MHFSLRKKSEQVGLWRKLTFVVNPNTKDVHLQELLQWSCFEMYPEGPGDKILLSLSDVYNSYCYVT